MPRRTAPASKDPASDEPMELRLLLDWPWIRQRLAAGGENDQQALRVHCAIRAGSRWQELYDGIIQETIKEH